MANYKVRRKPKPMLSDERIDKERQKNGGWFYMGHVNGSARFWRNEPRFDVTIEKRVPVNPALLTLYGVETYRGKRVNLTFVKYPTYKSMIAALAKRGIEFKKVKR